jgi:hypothetical protein
MSLNVFMGQIAEEFSGREFTEKDLMNFITGSVIIGTGVGFNEEPKKKGKGKKQPKVKKLIRMTFRTYMMTKETDVFKVKVTEQVAENKEWNTDNAEKIDAGEEEKKPENFFAVLSAVQHDLSDEEEEHIKQKVQEYNETHFGGSDDEAE